MSERQLNPNFIALADGSVVNREAALDIATHIYLGVSGVSPITCILALHRFIHILGGNEVRFDRYQRDIINRTLNTGIFELENWKQATTTAV